MAQQDKPVESTRQYVVLEGGGPDQGPGGNVQANIMSLADRFGPMPATSQHMIAYGVQQIRLLSRSVSGIRHDVEQALDLAEQTGIPIFLHVDSCYGWGADTETQPEDAPRIKFWQHPEMREWDRFPVNGQLPERFPRQWFSWGPWCSPAAAVPAFGSPKFVTFVTSQLDQGVLAPLADRLAQWQQSDRAHLFAGINIAWEAHVPNFGDPTFLYLVKRSKGDIRAEYPKSARGIKMDPNFVGKQLGYASLHWQGWNESRLVKAANTEGVTRDEKFRQLCYHSLQTYMAALAKACHDRGLDRNRVYTHIVALASVDTASTTRPPIWTAVNPYATPGFTMDNQGAAKYDLPNLLTQIRKADSNHPPCFGVVESYFSLHGQQYVQDTATCLRDLETLFEAGAHMQAFYGGFPLQSLRIPETALIALKQWLDQGVTSHTASQAIH